MTDALIDPATPTLANGGSPAAPPPTSDPVSRAAPRPSVPENPRARGHSPARDTYEAAAARAAPKPGPGASYEQQRFAQDQAAPAAPGEPAPGEPPAAEAAPAADGAPQKFKIGKYEVSEADLGAMMERQALEDLRKATAPPTAEAYKAELLPDLKLPGGVEYKLDASNPGIAAARNWAHAKGLTQSEFSEMLGIYASHEAQQQAALAERSRQEIAKVGVNGPQRVDAIAKWITGMIGEADAAPIKATLVTDAHVRFYEKIINQLTNQGGASFSQSHRVPPDNNKIPGFENMSFEQQRYAQDQLAMRRGR